jgi:4-amino-4-deoxy-L-arabinose transferase-like glycosyltransferase
MYALIPQEMLAAGAWLKPTLNGAPYLDKPPLLYWLTMISYQVFGVSEGAARLPNLLGALGEIWFTYLLGRRLFNQRAALLGGFILLTSVGFFIQHLIILADHLVNAFLTASVYVFWRWQEKPIFRWVAGFYLLLAMGFLSKSFIGLVFPAAIVALYAFSIRQFGLLALFASLRGWGLFLLLTVPWLAAMEVAYPGFLWHHLMNEQVLRFLGHRYPQDINSFSILEFWVLTGLWLLPWTLLLPEALHRFWREAARSGGSNPEGRLLLVWAGVIMGFFSLSSSRIEYYSLPAFPALALVLGWQFHRHPEVSRDRNLLWPLLLMTVSGLLISLLFPHLQSIFGANRRELNNLLPFLDPLIRQGGIAIPLLAGLSLLFGWRRPRLAQAGYGGLAFLLLYFSFQAYAAISPLVSDQLVGMYIRNCAAPQDVVVMEYIEEFEYGASLAFYSQRRIFMVQRGDLPQFPYPVSPKDNYLIAPEQLQDLWQGSARVFVLADDAIPLEGPLENAPLQVAFAGKRLVMNRPPQQGGMTKTQTDRRSPRPWLGDYLAPGHFSLERASLVSSPTPGRCAPSRFPPPPGSSRFSPSFAGAGKFYKLRPSLRWSPPGATNRDPGGH